MKSLIAGAVIALFFLALPEPMIAQWIIQNSTTQQNLRSISFVDSLTGWIAGDGGIILHTTTGGQTWEKQNSNTVINLNCISFCDSMNGWAVGYSGMIINTSDGGKNWNRIIHDTADNIRNTRVKCFDKSTVIISRIAWAGDFWGGGKLWYWGSDSEGTGWRDISPYSGSGLIFLIYDFDFISRDIGWVTKMDGLNYDWVSQVSHTTDRGRTWKSNQIPSLGYISFSDTVSGLLTNGSGVYTYIDSANTFEQIDSLGFYAGQSICRIGRIGYVSSSGSIMKSTDDGKKWVKQPLVSGASIYDIEFITPEIGWAVGSSGLIVQTVNGGVTSIRDDHVNDYGFELNQNYPDPFNPSTTIRYGLPNRSGVMIVITNTLGQQVAVLENGEREAGYHEVQWHADVASGIYFYRIEATALNDPAKHFVDTKKMLLLK